MKGNASVTSVAILGCSVGMCMPACTKRDRAKELNNLGRQGCPGAVSHSFACVTGGAVVPPGKTQRFWCKGQWKEKKVFGGMRSAGQGRPVPLGVLCRDATMVLQFSCSGLKGFVLGKIFLKENCYHIIVEISISSECIPGQVTKSTRFANRRNSRW